MRRSNHRGVGRSLRAIFIALAAMVFVTAIAMSEGCRRSASSPPSGDTASDDDLQQRFAISELPVKYLSQNWTPAQSLEFYGLRQGSPIIRKDFFDALEQPAEDDTRQQQGRFADSEFLGSFGFLRQQPHASNPDGYPIGFVADDAIELNCSACHTSRMTFGGVEFRIDGGQAATDIEAWLTALVTALRQTLADAPEQGDLSDLLPSDTVNLDRNTRFGRFAARLLDSETASVGQLFAIKSLLERDFRRRQRYEDYNHFGQPVSDEQREELDRHPPYGFARLDALGAILNQACAEDLNRPDNADVADAPVNYPAIWDAPQHARVQWNGAVDNLKAFGPLGRNAGQVIGVFGLVDVDGDAWIGYDSSIRFAALRRAESLITTLWSPRWPTEFGAIDDSMAEAGERVYRRECVDCHALMSRDDPDRDPRDVLIPVSRTWRDYPPLDTDPRTAANFLERTAAVGPLAGRYSGKPLGPRFPSDEQAQVPARDILSHLVARTLVRSFVPWRRELTLDDEEDNEIMMSPAADGPLLEYKARPLNGVWSTAPYLHNGSVLNLPELLRPPEKRIKEFRTGTVAFDPETLGFENDGPFLFDTRKDGNSNRGHSYGTGLSPDEKRALIEFIKTL